MQNWRDEMLAKAWTALGEAERSGGQPYFSVLKFRSEHPDASSAEMAARLTEQLQPQSPFTETGIRKTLQRARERFAESLIAEVARSLGTPTDDELEEELIAVGLLPYCRSALQQRERGQQSGAVNGPTASFEMSAPWSNSGGGPQSTAHFVTVVGFRSTVTITVMLSVPQTQPGTSAVIGAVVPAVSASLAVLEFAVE